MNEEQSTTIARRDQVAQLLAAAVDKNLGVDALEKLVGLQERMLDREARMSFHRALAAFQSQVGAVPKKRVARVTTKSGGSYSYHFANRADIIKHCAPILHSNGLSIHYDSEFAEGRTTYRATLSHVDGHSRTSSVTLSSAGDPTMRMNALQRSGTEAEYGMRYATVQVLGLTQTEDADDHDGAGFDPINETQAADLYALIDETKTPINKFLQWQGIKSVEELPIAAFGAAVRYLEAKRDKGKP